jgi:exopolyphosphatase/guanosine-5'-triphosphate,3'-diphosphate pyrophosphatase
MRKIAVIDLGTNTFNLLIATVNGDGSYQIIHNSKLPAKLGEGGIVQKIIIPEAFQRGINAFGEHFRTILLHGVSEIYAFATSAIRNASNGNTFVSDIKNLFGIEVKVVDGQEEAELIYFGVKQAVELDDQNVLILDIGGGSNEIIIGNNSNYHWKRSYDLGISRMLQKFNPSDPIKESEIEEVEKCFDAELFDLIEPIEKFKPQVIIGSSGSFDTYRSVLSASNLIKSNGDPSAEIPIGHYIDLHKHLITTNKQQRNAIPGMDSMRVEMIVLASIFTHFLVNKFNFQRMLQSSYSLKEGALWKIVSTS